MPAEGRSTSTPAGLRINPAALTGAWVNTESSPRGVARVVIERRPDALGIGVLGADDRTHEGWGWTDAEVLYAGSEIGEDAVAFTAAYREDLLPVVLHANVSKGLLIVSSFQTRVDAGHSVARFAREFFCKAEPEGLNPLERPGDHSEARPVASSSPLSTFAGTWRNTNSEGSGIVSVRFAGTVDGATMRVFGRDDSGLQDWGTTAVELYTEIGTEAAKIKALFDLGSMDVLLHGWVKQGVLVLALFRRFKDESGRSNYFDREFFFRTHEPPGGVG